MAGGAGECSGGSDPEGKEEKTTEEKVKRYICRENAQSRKADLRKKTDG